MIGERLLNTASRDIDGWPKTLLKASAWVALTGGSYYAADRLTDNFIYHSESYEEAALSYVGQYVARVGELAGAAGVVIVTTDSLSQRRRH